jgi:hypothetical protein
VRKKERHEMRKRRKIRIMQERKEEELSKIRGL